MIFPLVWRILPGPTAIKLIALLVLLAAAVFVLFTWTFPWIADNVLPAPDASIDGP